MFIFTIVDFLKTFEQEFSTVVDHTEKGTLPYSSDQSCFFGE
jgi:hypothetical protein